MINCNRIQSFQRITTLYYSIRLYINLKRNALNNAKYIEEKY